MPDTIRVTISAPDSETAEAVKEAHFKKLFQHEGTKVVFELPEDHEDEAKALIAEAEKKGCSGSHELHKDELEDAEPVDFW